MNGGVKDEQPGGRRLKVGWAGAMVFMRVSESGEVPS